MSLKPFRASASQISTWKLCHRKWFYDKVLKIPQGYKPGTEVGTAIHTALEDYQATGKRLEGSSIVSYRDNKNRLHEVDIVPILKEVWDYPLVVDRVMEPGTVGERKVDIFIGDIPLTGRIDLSWQDGSTMYIMDYKSTKNFKYMLDPEEATYDPQTIVYSSWALEQDGVEEVVFYFLYIRTVAPFVKPRPIEVRHTKETLKDYLDAASEILLEMKKARQVPEYRIAQNKDACWKYGRCAYQQKCYEVPTISPQSEEKMADFQDLLNKHAAKVAKAPSKPKSDIQKRKAEAPKPVAKTEPAQKKPEDKTTVNLDGFPIIYFGCQPINDGYILLEDWLDANGFMEQYSNNNKGQYYLTSPFNAGERVIAVAFCAAVYEGKVTLPRHLVISDSSKIGYYVRLETRYLKERALLVGKSAI